MEGVKPIKLRIDGPVYAVAALLELAEPLSLRALLRAVEGPSGVKTVALNPEVLAGPAHVLTAAEYALKAFKRGRNAARSFHVEVMLFAAATREISRALPLMGPPEGAKRVAIVCIADSQRACLEHLEKVARELRAAVVPLRRNPEAAAKAAEALGLEKRELEATYAGDLAEAVEKALLSRMALEYLSR
ncbi:MAG: hypothetical protein DRJ96_00325 [Thermoprotei archaeon]|nr:MAG: hypothetical protein DRJ96_00325 [Thermoprotei archaeon]